MFIRLKQKNFGRWTHTIWLNLNHILSIERFYKNGEESYLITDINGKHYDVIDTIAVENILDYLSNKTYHKD